MKEHKHFFGSQVNGQQESATAQVERTQDSPSTDQVGVVSPFRVCILDGDWQAGLDLERILSSMGCEVLCLDRVIGASNRIRSYDPDLLVVDVQMPSLSGAGLLEVLRKNLRSLPVLILYSSLDEQKLMKMAHTAGADAFVIKNGNYVSLLSKIKYYSLLMSGS